MKGSLLFDLDGTLTDPREGIVGCHRYALERLDVPVPSDDELARLIGPPLHDGFRYLLGPSRGHLLADAVAHFRERFSTLGLFENAVYPGISEGLGALVESGWKLFIATSKPLVYARRILEHFELARHFTAIHGSELSGERSDKGELISHLLQTESVPAAQAIMIGDRLHDVVGAKRNQVHAVGVLWGYGSREELVGAGADTIYATVPEMVSALR